ncbi:MAG TPA: HdeD family acid-resistance protein [Anaeromyxobacteraceae bacterium]|nr:HdeD family acid-resistance protein [Anaeromyxobacteraceae bacterium]
MATMIETTMLARRWWVLALRGAAAIAFGILTFFWPGASLLALVLLFGIYALVNGAINLALAARSTGEGRWSSMAFEGVASIVAGALAILWPGITGLVLLFLIAAWAVVTGFAQIVAAIRLRKRIRGEWLLALAGVLSAAFGVFIAVMPSAGALAVVLWIGAYALVFGVILIALAFRLRAWERSTHRPLPAGGVPAAL